MLDSGNDSRLLIKDTQLQLWIEEIREMFRSMGGGKMSPSAYDTAWVSLIPAVDGTQRPQFPGCLQWIVNNQLEDGSWGSPDFFYITNNVLCTLMCIIALKTWNTRLESVEKGASFLRKNLVRLENVAFDPQRNVGIELVLPKLFDEAKKLGLNIPYDLPSIHEFRATREKKLQKLPLELLNSTPTTILHSLEAVHDVVDWEQVIQLQQEDGSLLTSPAATACAYLHTGNEKCLQFLTSVIEEFDHAAPPLYPVDIFERGWVVDKLHRLGIAHLFEPEIKNCLDFLYKHFSSSSNGLSWASTGNVKDLDDTAMSFRLLRLHGYDVSAECFQSFQDGRGGWFTFPGQMNQGITATLNLYRASQVGYREESILHREAAEWSRKRLVDKFNNKKFVDKWVMSKDIAGEVGFALQNPWYQTLPRLEHRSYLDQYGADDLWIAKVWCRFFNINNTSFLNLAKADFNLCQRKHQEELRALLRWGEESGLKGLNFGREDIVDRFFIAVCCLPAPEFSMARRVWSQLALLCGKIEEFFGSLSELHADKLQFVAAFASWNPKLMEGMGKNAENLFVALYDVLTDIATVGSFIQGRDISHHLHGMWLKLVENRFKESEWQRLNYQPSLDEYISVAEWGISMEAMMPAQYFMGEKISHDKSESPHTKRLIQLGNVTSRMSHDIQAYQWSLSENRPNFVLISKRNGKTDAEAVETSRHLIYDQMRELVKEVHSPSKCQPVLPRSVRQLYFNTVRSCLYTYQTGGDVTSTIPSKEKSVSRILYEPVLM
ncbi:hypothetical protein Mapa_009212 [Marchantia paleacea]|nr:hypothetical protein Mapa_009212 [Marchantia paleacea]